MGRFGCVCVCVGGGGGGPLRIMLRWSISMYMIFKRYRNTSGCWQATATCNYWSKLKLVSGNQLPSKTEWLQAVWNAKLACHLYKYWCKEANPRVFDLESARSRALTMRGHGWAERGGSWLRIKCLGFDSHYWTHGRRCILGRLQVHLMPYGYPTMISIILNDWNSEIKHGREDKKPEEPTDKGLMQIQFQMFSVCRISLYGCLILLW